MIILIYCTGLEEGHFSVLKDEKGLTQFFTSFEEAECFVDLPSDARAKYYLKLS